MGQYQGPAVFDEVVTKQVRHCFSHDYGLAQASREYDLAPSGVDQSLSERRRRLALVITQHATRRRVLGRFLHQIQQLRRGCHLYKQTLPLVFRYFIVEGLTRRAGNRDHNALGP